MDGKRYAVLLCTEDSEYVMKMYGGYFRVFIRMLAEEGETWDVYKVASGDFPEEDGDLDLYDGFVITGSCNDAHGNDAWIERLITLIQKIDSMKKKILGICFGHQILCRALGGKVSRSPTGWDIGVRSITLSSSSPLSPTSLMLPSKLSIIQCHRDEVRELPAKAEIIAWSEKTGIEMFRFGDHIMGIQGHPEYTIDILLHLIDRLVQRDLILEAYGVEARAKAVLREPDREVWKKLCVSFLKSRP
ncbi:gamma-glutamyl peptidase 5-like [Prosopis cineraria]|uniref:gamma-glutamyl peptidase 5-like n=1 Tax=Prosopis cineraria TaxID=364024 RepID=UPI0024107871|nr:gamma-glutamyl peptidase 5-like [Prosopis cineraria]